jgi:hypothetical protein
MNRAVNRIIQFSTFMAGFFLSSLPCPASLNNWPRVVIACVYLIALLTVRPGKYWIKLLIIFSLIIGPASGFSYWISLDTRSVKVDGQVHVKGKLTKTAQDYLEKHPLVTEIEYFIWTGKREREVWTPDSLRKNKLYLGILYSLFVGLTGFGILGALEITARSKPPWERSKTSGSRGQA